ncbi:MAG: sugar phosphate nucleotidyltransferase [Coxiella-like endosymbiont]|uniref:sugar phosphate nucleotidyltransferase n=1 Tax=Coxiella-like endosymbiont TaxID=1592897 RepID=UPI00215B57A0|nr:sugar phosphate nucleotidyltransferase [Coxiella-like endosymbiont]UVE59504.1 NTP transferase domain-containing protein [Coxiella-like endosymbiont]
MTLTNSTEALVLAGGFGTRLQSIVNNVPKPMAPINDQPFLSYLLIFLYRQGIRRTYISLHHLPKTITRYFGNHFHEMELHYFIEPKPLGTGGAILFCLNQIQPTQPIFILNGDTYSSCPLNLMKESYLRNFHKKSILSVSITVAPQAKRYNRLILKNERITSFQAHEANLNWINAGIYLVAPELAQHLSLLGRDLFSFENDFLDTYCQRYFFHAFPFSGTLIDIGVPEDYCLFQKKMKTETL